MKTSLLIGGIILSVLFVLISIVAVAWRLLMSQINKNEELYETIYDVFSDTVSRVDFDAIIYLSLSSALMCYKAGLAAIVAGIVEIFKAIKRRTQK